MAGIEAWKRKRTPLKAKLSRVRNAFLAYDQNLGLGTWAIQLEKFEPLYSECDAVQVEIEMLADGEDAVKELKERDEFESLYFETVANIRHFIENCRSIRLPVARSNDSASTSRSQDSQLISNEVSNLLSMRTLLSNLPTIALPKFDGSFKDWVKFRDSFKTMVHERSELSNIQKFHYLSSSLTGDAARVIQSLGISDVNYELAWESLTDRYEDSRSLIHYHIKSLFELQPIARATCLALRQLIDEANNHMLALKALGENTESWDTMATYLLSTKLDYVTKREWEKHLLSSTETQTFKRMIQFLENHCKYLQRVTFDKSSSQNYNNQQKQMKINNNKNSERLTSHPAVKKRCLLCDNSHALVNCDKLLTLPVNARIGQIARLRVCFNCLKPGHRNKDCTNGPCAKCPGRHNTILHIEKNTEELEEAPSSSKEVSEQCIKTTLVAHSARERKNHILLGTAIVYVKDRCRNRHECRALLDSCSQVNIMTQKLCNRLKLPVDKSDVIVSGVFKSTQEPQYCTQVIFSSRCTGYSNKITCLVTPEITDEMPNVHLRRSDFKIPGEIILADPTFADTDGIDLLIGGGVFWKLLCVGQIQLRDDQPLLQKTQLGWIVAGEMKLPSSLRKPRATCNIITNQQLRQEIQRFWEIEDHSFKEKYPQLDPGNICEQYFNATTERDSEGRFIVAMSLKEEVNELGDSFNMAHKRLLAMEKKLSKDSNLQDKYQDFMNDYASQGHMKLIPQEEIITDRLISYLPHHAVMKESSTTTKVRVVFDGSAKTSSGLSFNAVQRIGYVVQNDLFSIALRFRQHPIVLSADITQMYRQIRIREDQQDLQRILWRSDPSLPIQHFRLATVTYGTASAPFLATRALRQIGEENKEKYPDTSEVIIRDFYVDDLLTGAQTLEEAKKLRHELVGLLSSAGLELRKWASNNSRVFAEGNVSSTEKLIQTDKDPKTLGLIWDPHEDKLKYSVKDSSSEKATKRTILSKIAQIFDPLGLVGPAVIRAKLIMQKLWQLQLGWNEALPQDIHTMWLDFSEQLKSLNTISVPRFVCCEEFTEVQFHGFCDASEAAYGACVYLRTLTPAGQIAVRLLCAKSRVAPLKKISLPRFELQAAVLLAQLLETCSTALTLNMNEKHFWTDSTVTLSWIQSPSSRWKTYVANRTSEIQRLTNNNWHHVSTRENPADLISRGINPRDLSTCEIWWKGPSWLSQPQEDWPVKQRVNLETLEIISEERKCERVLIVTTEHEFDLLERYSSLNRVIRVTAYCVRFIKNAKCNKDHRKQGELEAMEISGALTYLLRLAQIKDFSSEIRAIENSKKAPYKGKLCSLNPFLDQNGILRVGGRLVNAPIPFDQKHPIILASNNPLTALIISEEHKKLMHAGCQAVMASVRTRFWPLSCKNTVKGILRKCIKCFRAQPVTTEYVMGNLPSARVTPNRPFYVCGVDYAGPYYLSERLRSRVTHKAYICIFVCFVTKAVHIELAHDLSTNAFLNCLRRFVSRRGKCQHIHSDNGTNFVGARNELHELSALLQTKNFQETVHNFLSQEQIQWHMIPPRAPYFGGLWEGAVKSMKKHLSRVIGESRLMYEEMYTVLTQVECCLNSRPLSPLSNDPNDFIPLTPGHFLIGDSLAAVPQSDLQDIPRNRLSRYEHLQQMLQHFWQRWRLEYLSQLQQRNKWAHSKSNSLTPGSMVIVKEDNLPPMQWRLGRILQLHPGRDNITLVVSIRVSGSVIKRPIAKICVLPIDQDKIELPN